MRGTGPGLWRVRPRGSILRLDRAAAFFPTSFFELGPSRLRKKRMTTALLFSTRCARGPLSEWKDAQEPSRAADCGPRRDRPRRAETVPGRSRALGREGSNPDQVVRGEGK